MWVKILQLDFKKFLHLKQVICIYIYIFEKEYNYNVSASKCRLVDLSIGTFQTSQPRRFLHGKMAYWSLSLFFPSDNLISVKSFIPGSVHAILGFLRPLIVCRHNTPTHTHTWCGQVGSQNGKWTKYRIMLWKASMKQIELIFHAPIPFFFSKFSWNLRVAIDIPCRVRP